MASIPHRSPDPTERQDKLRRRTAYACNSCRNRKTRCNGRQPCATCTALAIDCIYGSDASSTKGKSDLILSAVLRIENAVNQIGNRVSNLSTSHPGSSLANRSIGPTAAVGSPSSGVSPFQLQPCLYNHTPSSNVVDNAIISSSHSSTTESILAWPSFDHIGPLRSGREDSVFTLECSRPDLPFKSLAPPYLDFEDIERIIHAFQNTVNFFYPIVSHEEQQDIKDRVISGDFTDSLDSCLALAVMALGCAGEFVSGTLFTEENNDIRDRPKRYLPLSHAYFKAALKMVYTASPLISLKAAQCLLLIAFYYAFLQRPLQAWSMLSSVASKCRVLLTYGSLKGDEETECVRRIFWSCYILESDYLAELSVLPQFGIAEMESSVPLPGRFFSHENDEVQSRSSLYFLACISMRRLLNRVHHLLFDSESSVNLRGTRLANIIAELDQQLREWRECLPPEFQFPLDRSTLTSQHAAFLRQRYLTCKALIYRPYLVSVLSIEDAGLDATILNGCRICLEACVLHCTNLNNFSHTILFDVWICALSMSGTILVLLAVATRPGLRDCLIPEVFEIGPHLQHLLGQWMTYPSQGHSPSVERAIQWIKIAHDALET